VPPTAALSFSRCAAISIAINPLHKYILLWILTGCGTACVHEYTILQELVICIDICYTLTYHNSQYLQICVISLAIMITHTYPSKALYLDTDIILSDTSQYDINIIQRTTDITCQTIINETTHTARSTT
jgi:hypothetical protein